MVWTTVGAFMCNDWWPNDWNYAPCATFTSGFHYGGFCLPGSVTRTNQQRENTATNYFHPHFPWV